MSTTILPLFAFSCLLFLVSLAIISKTRTRRPSPPQAGGAWPLIGHLPLLAGKQPVHVTLSHMADKYGPIFTINMGVHRALVVSGWEIAKECLTKNDAAFATRPKSAATEILGYNQALFGFAPYGTYWRHVRRIATVELLSNQRLEKLKDIRESEINTAIRELYNGNTKTNNVFDDNGNEFTVEMRGWLGEITLNLILRIIVGKRVSASGADGKWKEALKSFFELSGQFTPADGLPWLKPLDIGALEGRMKKTAKELDRFVEGWLEEHKRKRESGGGDEDFMDVMLSTVSDTAEHDADAINKATCLNLILAGSDTSAITMTWALSLLLNNPEALRKAQQELDNHVGKERLVQESDMKSLVYLPAILKEAMRLYPAGPLSVPHEAIEDCTVSGYHVRAGTRLLVNLYHIHRDPNVWADPLEFRPERFLTTHKEFDVRGQSFEYMPFSSGRRMCPGISFALQVMQLTLAKLLHGFDFTTRSGEPVDMTEAPGITMLKATPLEVVINRRLPARCYL